MMLKISKRLGPQSECCADRLIAALSERSETQQQPCLRANLCNSRRRKVVTNRFRFFVSNDQRDKKMSHNG